MDVCSIRFHKQVTYAETSKVTPGGQAAALLPDPELWCHSERSARTCRLLPRMPVPWQRRPTADADSTSCSLSLHMVALTHATVFRPGTNVRRRYRPITVSVSRYTSSSMLDARRTAETYSTGWETQYARGSHTYIPVRHMSLETDAPRLVANSTPQRGRMATIVFAGDVC